MIHLTAEAKIVKQIPELTTMVLESMTVNEETVLVALLEGTKNCIKLERTESSP